MTDFDDIQAERHRKLRQTVAQRQTGVVVIEDVRDPHNAEAVVRSCDAFGIQTVYLIFEQEAPFDPWHTGRLSSSSANKWVDFQLFGSTADCLTTLKNEGYQLIATALTEDSEDLFTAQFEAQHFALLLGNENRGLSETALAMADRTLNIPMRGMVQSFNLSVTAGICLYEITRQRLLRGMAAFQLPEDTQADLFDNFLMRRYPPPQDPADLLADPPES